MSLLTDNERSILLAMHAGARFVIQSGVSCYGCLTVNGEDRQQYNRAAFAGLRDKGLVRRSDATTAVFTPLGQQFAKAIAKKRNLHGHEGNARVVEHS